MHGGDTYGYENLTDLSINLHPFGVPPEITATLRGAVEEISAYPDPYCRDLRTAISQRDGVKKEEIICGNGAADLIFRLVQQISPKKALIPAPTFAAYQSALSSVGCEIKSNTLLPENNFNLDEGFLQSLTEDIQMVFLCTPNNPTARVISPVIMEKIAEKCLEIRCYLVIDECFLELSHHPHSFHELLKNSFVVLLRAFTKSYALAGLRLGYCLTSNEKLRESLISASQPWSVSSLAQVAGRVACGLPEWTEQGRAWLREEQPRLEAGLLELGVKIWPGEGNFLLFQWEGEENLQEKLLSHQVFIRDCSNFPGLGKDFYRVAISLEKNRIRLLESMKKVAMER